jgi:hypothetical protein
LGANKDEFSGGDRCYMEIYETESAEEFQREDMKRMKQMRYEKD